MAEAPWPVPAASDENDPGPVQLASLALLAEFLEAPTPIGRLVPGEPVQGRGNRPLAPARGPRLLTRDAPALCLRRLGRRLLACHLGDGQDALQQDDRCGQNAAGCPKRDKTTVHWLFSCHREDFFHSTLGFPAPDKWSVDPTAGNARPWRLVYIMATHRELP